MKCIKGGHPAYGRLGYVRGFKLRTSGEPEILVQLRHDASAAGAHELGPDDLRFIAEAGAPD